MKAVIVIIVLAILVGGGYALYHNKHKATPAASTTNSTSSSNGNMNGSTSGSSSSSMPSATNAVSISNFAFSPNRITVKKGTKVTWTNNDSTTHTVTGDNGGPSSGNVAPGQSYSFTFDTAGTFKYHCSIHPDMTGSVTVTE